MNTTRGYKMIVDWMEQHDREPFAFQVQTWEQISKGQSGLVNAPTGYGKTFSVFLGALIRYINENPDDYLTKKNAGLQLLWITPLRALAKDIGRAMEEVLTELGLPWKTAIRNGDTPVSERQRQKRSMPQILIITPESLHLLLAQKGYADIFSTLQIVCIDEWHELLGSKRGVQVELALSRLAALHRIASAKVSALSIWGISATIGNLEEAREVLLSVLDTGSQIPPARLTPARTSLSGWPVGRGNQMPDEGYQMPHSIISAEFRKATEIESIIPEEIEKYPWAGHLGIKLAERVLPIINKEGSTTLIFINTRGMSEQWYQKLLNIAPELSGAIALHHGSIEQDLRVWVEEALHTGVLQAVVCTSSLDLGVDFRPVDTVIQVGSPKGVARFLQRAGRSGHQPGAISKIYFLPTHSLELMEAAALKEAIAINFIESRPPLILCFDVLLQYLCTLAVSDGFDSEKTLDEVRSTFCFREITDDEWKQLIHFLTIGGEALQQYDDYKKVEFIDGLYRITSRRIAMRHRMHIGTIVSDSMIKVKFMGGGYVGMIEESFISRLSPGDVFTLAGRNLEFVMIREMTALVRKSNARKSIVPSWMGGRVPLSANLGMMLRKKLDDASRYMNLPENEVADAEVIALRPLLELQSLLSLIPRSNELLIEQIETKEGFHMFVYPFEGRLVHEAMAALLAYRISRITPITFSIAMNDYGFELLSDQPIPLDDSNSYELFTEENLVTDIQASVNATEMARRKFRDIAVIGGLIFQGRPGEFVKARHLQSSASLLFNVFAEYEPANLLLRQAYHEVMSQQMDEERLRNMLRRIQSGKITITFPAQLTPFCFPVMVDSMRTNLTSEKLEDRVKKMQVQLERKLSS